MQSGQERERGAKFTTQNRESSRDEASGEIAARGDGRENTSHKRHGAPHRQATLSRSSVRVLCFHVSFNNVLHGESFPGGAGWMA